MTQNIDTPYITDQALLKYLKESVRGKMKYTLMNDFLAKYGLQTDLYALKGLLAALLQIPINSITDIQVINPTEPSGFIEDKDCVLDIKLEINHKELINIEIQNDFQDYWPDRAVTYVCRMFDNLYEGDDYNKVKPCIHIGILNFALYEDGTGEKTKEFYSDYRIMNTKTHDKFTDKFIIKALMLKNLDYATEEQKADSGSVYYWAKLFKAKTWEELRMIAKNNEYMESLVNTTSKLSGDRKVREACEARLKYQLDINTYKHRIEERDEMLEEKDRQLEEKEVQLEERDRQIEEKEVQLEEKDRQLEEKDVQLEERDRQIEEKDVQIEEKDDEIRRLKEILAQYES